jgi:hypothetical protein
MAVPGTKSILEELIDQNLIDQPVFAFYMTSKSSGIPPELTFGYIDNSKYEGDIHWAPVKKQLMYGVQLNDIGFNGIPSGVCSNKNCLITFDSGCSLITFPKFAV